MDDNAIDDILKGNPVFSSLDDVSRKHLRSKFEIIDLVANEILFFQGDSSECIYLLTEGKLAAELLNNKGENKIVGRLLPGEIVGEIGVLTNEPRSLTIKALTNSMLLKLLASEFLEVVRNNPSILRSMLYPLISRSTELIKMISMDKTSNNIVIVPANRSTSLESFSNELNLLAKQFKNTLVISNYHADFMDKHLAVSEIQNKVKSLMVNAKHTHTVCYILSSTETSLAKYAFQYDHALYVIANADGEVKIDHQVLERIEHRGHHVMTTSSLVLLHSPETLAPQHSIAWLKLAKFELYHHVQMGRVKDFQRIFRFMRGKAVGVVLGGGGTRGWAHLGALKALRESKIPIDIIGGTSVGALVAGLYAMHRSYKKTYKSFRQMVIESEHPISWRSLTWPILSLFNAKKFTKAQVNVFRNNRIENLWTSYFCITSNLSTNSEDVQQDGLLWEVVRASAAIPGLVPPMLLNGELQVDGGLLNNLPVDVMRRLIGKNGKVIAVQLNNIQPDKSKYQFPPIFTFTDALLNKLRIRKEKYKFPPLLDTFLHAVFLNSSLKEHANAMISNVYVSPNLAEFKILYSNLEEGERLVQIGYEETMKQIKNAKKKNAFPVSY